SPGFCGPSGAHPGWEEIHVACGKARFRHHDPVDSPLRAPGGFCRPSKWLHAYSSTVRVVSVLSRPAAAGRRGLSGTVGVVMTTDRLESLLTFHPFTRLNGLLQGIAPGGGGQPLLFSVGEPQMTPPPLLSEILVREAAQWSKYPLAQGTPEFRAAATDWLRRRYHLPEGMIDADKQLLPVAGSREGLFMIALSAVPEWADGKRPAVLIPNPFYHVYAGAAAVAGADPVFLPT